MPLERIYRSLKSGLDLNLRSTAKWLVLSSLVGVVAGMGAISFHLLCQLVAYQGLGPISGFFPGEPAGEHVRFERQEGVFSMPLVILVMAAGGLISGLIVYTLAPEAEGHGTDAAIDAYHRKRGVIRPRIPLVKMVASAITIGTGGSGGREGPIAQIGAGFGSFLATALKLPARDRRILLAAGMGAGVGAIFRAPLAGAIFAAEIFYREADFESEVFIPAAFSSIISYSVYCLSLPAELRFLPLFGRGLDFHLDSLVELLPLAVLGLMLAIAGFAYVRAFYGARDLFKKLPIPRGLRPAVGAALAGLFAAGIWWLGDGDRALLAVLSTGYLAIQDALDPAMTIGAGALLAIALGKIVTTSLTIGSGGSGGVFGPSMVIGGSLGGAVGRQLHALSPSVVTEPRAYVIIGMAGFFAGVARAPFSTIIMVSEMTGDYRLLLPTMWVSTLAFLLSRRWTIYEKQVWNRLESPAHRGDLIVDILGGLRVRDVFTPDRPLVTVPESMPLAEILQLLARTTQGYFPVLDSRGDMVGIFSAKDLRPFLYDDTIWGVTIARDVMVTDVLSVVPDDDLNTALRRFTTRNLDEIPVVDPENPGRLLGMARRKDVIALYNQRLAEEKGREE